MWSWSFHASAADGDLRLALVRRSPIRPVRASSRTPYGRTSSSNASIWSGRPTISNVTASRPTSATRAFATWLSAISSARRSGGAATVISASSRSTASSGTSSVTRSTFTSLCICFSICSSECSLQSTRSVSREMSECSVGPTARLWMLYPRLEKSCDTRASAPGRFSSRTLMVCSLISAPAPAKPARRSWPASSSLRRSCLHRLFVGRLEDVDGRGAGGHHREALLGGVAPDVDDGGPARVERRRQRALELVLRLDGEPGTAVGLGELRVRGHLVRQVRLREPLVVEHLLPLAHHAEPAVVDEDDDDRQPLEGRGRELLAGHLEAAVAVDADDGRVGARRLRADRGRDAVAHRPQAARRDERARALALDVLHRPHLVLPDACRPDEVVAAGGHVAERLDRRLRLQDAGFARVAERERLAPGLDLPQPRLVRDLCVDGRERLAEIGEGDLERADDRDLRVADLPDLCCVDVEVDDARARCERAHLAGDAVVEARADGDHEVGLVEGPVRVLRAVHARLAVVERVRVRQAA